MKKGLLSILAGALVVVGCQNYDDQFDQLESQINALASTVAGLSAVQSDLAALSAQVNSLSGAVDAAVDSALAGGLADIQSAIDALNAAAESAANNSDITAIAEDVDAVQTDLAELLAQSSVFQGNVVVSTPAMLDAYHAMGDGLAIINGYVDIDVSSDMDIAKTQELVDFILVTTGDFAYTAGTGVDTEVTFSNLTGTQSLTLDQEGGYMLENLESATKIDLDDDSSVDVVHLGSLTSVTSLKENSSSAGVFKFTKATELHLTSLPRSPHTTLTLGVDEGGVIDISALRDVDADGDDTKLILNLEGAASMTIANLSGDKAGSKIKATEVADLTINGYDGEVEIGEDVLNFTSDNLVTLSSTMGDDLVTFNVTGALDPNASTADTEGPAISLTGQGDLETVSIAGETDTIVIGDSTNGNGNLVSVTIAGNVVGAAGISIANNSDLTTVDVSAANTDKLVIDGNSDLEILTVDFTTAKGKATTQEGTITINNNESMTDLTISTDNIDNLTITNNADLETVDLSGMTAIGATGTASVTITGNDLTAEKSDNLDDGTTNVADGKSGDLGSFTTDSGLDTAKAYLTAVAADADSKANVVFDTVDSAVSNEGASESDLGSDIISGALTQVLVLTPKIVTTPAQNATKHRMAFGVSIAGGATDFGLAEPDGANLLVDGSENPQATLTLDANETLAIAAIKRAAALTRATAYDLTLDAHSGLDASGEIRFTAAADTSTAEYSFNADKNSGATTIQSTSDVLKLTVDGLSVTTTLSASGTSRAAIAEALRAAWATKYGTSGSASYSMSLFNVTSDTNKLVITAKSGGGRRGFNKSYSVSVTPYTTVGASTTLIAEYGATSSSADNNTISNGLVVTLESNVAGVLLDAVKGATVTSNSGTSVTILTTTNKPVADVATTTTANIFPDDARGDAVLPESSVTEVATAATAYNRVSWL